MHAFSLDLTATQTAKLLGLNRNTANRIYNITRVKLAQYQEEINDGFEGEVELDESYFGGKRRKGRRGRGTGKTPVFGILKRKGRVFTQVIKNAKKDELMPIIKALVKGHSTIYTDKWRAYDGLVLDGYRHYRVNHSKDEFSAGNGNHINGIENFWSFAKRRLTRFNGVAPSKFYLHLKECEFRYNEKDVYKKLLQVWRRY